MLDLGGSVPASFATAVSPSLCSALLAATAAHRSTRLTLPAAVLGNADV